MARSEPIRNTYEEFPDESKRLLKTTERDHGQRLATRPSKDVLIQDHAWHLHFLREGVLQSRNFILPLPYRPSRARFSQARPTRIADLRIGTRNAEEFVLLRTLTDPYVYSSSITIVEDEHGDGARLTVCNVSDLINDSVLSKGLLIAVKQPCWSAAPEGGFYIRVDHPSDLVILESSEDVLPHRWKSNKIVPTRTAGDWKKDGDMMFLRKKFTSASRM